jgi:regulator of RNase E activity RraB
MKISTRSSQALCLLTIPLLGACGGKDTNGGSAAPAAPLPDQVEIGDGVGAHGDSLETRTEKQIKELIAGGADPQKPHRIEHHLAARDTTIAKAIVSWGKDNGFEPVGFDEASVVAGEWINIDLVKPSKLELPLIWRDSSRISDLAESLDCEYDGWGCAIVE